MHTLDWQQKHVKSTNVQIIFVITDSTIVRFESTTLHLYLFLNIKLSKGESKLTLNLNALSIVEKKKITQTAHTYTGIYI